MAAQPSDARRPAEGASPWHGQRGPVLFEARLAPTRSLPPAGFLGVMLVAGGATTGIGLYVWSLGAWPVVGFCGLDILALYLAFRVSYAHARLTEHICLTADELMVARVWPGGRRQEWCLTPFWTRIELEGTAETGSRLELVCRGTRVVLGSFLSPEERAKFAAGLAEALDPARRKC
ncbi:MAG: DUF2244 domain-containing protein [Alphaproteobacteria bacterium]